MSIFTDKDFNSSNGMQTSIFGPSIWFNLHLISFNYPINPTEDDKNYYTTFLMSFKHVLPCVYCRNNFENNLKRAKFNSGVMANRDTFSRFIYRLHNCVNEMLGKNIRISYEEVRDRYEHFRSRCNEQEHRIEILNKQNLLKKEKKCEGSLYGSKSKCIIQIVPKHSTKDTFKMDSKCSAKKKSSRKSSKKKVAR